jgi:hypothetical protein
MSNKLIPISWVALLVNWIIAKKHNNSSLNRLKSTINSQILDKVRLLKHEERAYLDPSYMPIFPSIIKSK